MADGIGGDVGGLGGDTVRDEIDLDSDYDEDDENDEEEDVEDVEIGARDEEQNVEGDDDDDDDDWLNEGLDEDDFGDDIFLFKTLLHNHVLKTHLQKVLFPIQPQNQAMHPTQPQNQAMHSMQTLSGLSQPLRMTW